jgi:hypothetical protein
VRAIEIRSGIHENRIARGAGLHRVMDLGEFTGHLDHPGNGKTVQEPTNIQGEEKKPAFHDCPFQFLASLQDRGDQDVAVCGEREALRFNELYKIAENTQKDLGESVW